MKTLSAAYISLYISDIYKITQYQITTKKRCAFYPFLYLPCCTFHPPCTCCALTRTDMPDTITVTSVSLAKVTNPFPFIKVSFYTYLLSNNISLAFIAFK